MVADYSDEKLFQTASKIYETEAAMSRHYETLRTSLTAANFAIVSAILALEGDTNHKGVLIVILGVLAIVAGFLAIRLSHAHWFHFRLTSKMRGILARRHKKTELKLRYVRKSWKRSTRCLGRIGHAPLWFGLNVIPALAASIWLCLRPT